MSVAIYHTVFNITQPFIHYITCPGPETIDCEPPEVIHGAHFTSEALKVTCSTNLGCQEYIQLAELHFQKYFFTFWYILLSESLKIQKWIPYIKYLSIYQM